MLSNFIHVQYCYQYLVDQISLGLLLYSHIPVALIALAFSIFVLIKSKNALSILLFGICLTFTLWCVLDLNAWFAFLGPNNTMFVWSMFDLLAVLMFFLGFYFLYVFIKGEDIKLWQKIFGFIALLPTAYVSITGLNIPVYDLNSCAAIENGTFTIYTYCIEALIIVVSIIFVISQYRIAANKINKSRILLVGIGVIIFLGVFFSASFLVSQLAATDLSLYVYNYLIYGLFGMPVFLIYLGYLIVKFKAFDIKLIGSQALVWALVLLVGSQFFYLADSGIAVKILTAITLIISSTLGLILVRSVKKEIQLREKLEEANTGQTNLIHIMNHQIKGYLSIDKNIFAELLTDDYGKIPESAKDIISKGFESTDRGVNYVTSILRGASAEDGTLIYDMHDIDLKNVISKEVDKCRQIAEKKGLVCNVDIKDGDYKIVGDDAQLGEAIRNIIENSVYYTLQGSIWISMKDNKNEILITVKDTGVGIKSEDREKLFKTGGVTKDSKKINVNSSGYGLAFVKGVLEKHKGQVWFESAGENKGSTFYIKLPKNLV